MPTVSQSVLTKKAIAYLEKAGASPENAACVGAAIVQAEAEGNAICGLFYLPVFKEQMEVEKILGTAEPEFIHHTGGSTTVDAKNGFAHPAIELATTQIIDDAKRLGVAAASITNSTNCLSMAHHVLPLAEAGLIGMATSNAPATVAPPGGTKPVMGTNPLGFAVPGPDGPKLLIDQSSSAVTFTAIVMRDQAGDSMPEGWAQDASGQPTTDPATGLAGTMLPFGGQKGANIGLIVEILSAVLTNSNMSTQTSAFMGTEGGPAGIGQFLLAIDPAKFGGTGYFERLAGLEEAFEDGGLRFPGGRHFGDRDPDKTMIEVADEVWTTLP